MYVRDMDVYRMHFDGSARPGNPGFGGAGAVIYAPDGMIVEVYKYLGASITNNVAEYEGLILGLIKCVDLGARVVHVYGDSMLVVKQVQGLWKVKAVHLQALCDRAKQLLKTFDKCTVDHVMRADNAVADALANRAVEEKSDS